MATRDEMNAAIKAAVVPHLRGMGFKGSLPHFYRPRAGAVDLVSFQFSQWGGSFVVELGRIGPDGFDFHGQHIPPAKAKTSYLKERHRLGMSFEPNSLDHWFEFEAREVEIVAQEVCAEFERPGLWSHIDELEARV